MVIIEKLFCIGRIKKKKMSELNQNNFNLNVNTFIACLFFRKNKDNQIEMLTVRRPEDGGARWDVPQGKIDLSDFLDCDPDNIQDKSILKSFLKNNFKTSVNVDFDKSKFDIVKFGDYMLVCSVSEVDDNPMLKDKMDLQYELDLSEARDQFDSSVNQTTNSQWTDIWDFVGNNSEILQNNMLDAIINLLQKTD